MEKKYEEKEEQSRSVPEVDVERPLVGQPPEERWPEEKQSSEEEEEEGKEEEEEAAAAPAGECFLRELPPEMLQPQGRLSGKDLFGERPPMEQPPCGMGKEKLEEGSFKERLAFSRPQFRWDIHGRNLSNEEMIKAADEMEEMKRVRNKLMIMRWRAKRSRPYPT